MHYIDLVSAQRRDGAICRFAAGPGYLYVSQGRPRSWSGYNRIYPCKRASVRALGGTRSIHPDSSRPMTLFFSRFFATSPPRVIAAFVLMLSTSLSLSFFFAPSLTETWMYVAFVATGGADVHVRADQRAAGVPVPSAAHLPREAAFGLSAPGAKRR